jgi:hypothetical protein
MNLGVLPASCRQKKLASADETAAARCRGARLSRQSFMVPMHAKKRREAFHERQGRASSPLRADACNHRFLQAKGRRARSDAPYLAQRVRGRRLSKEGQGSIRPLPFSIGLQLPAIRRSSATIPPRSTPPRLHHNDATRRKLRVRTPLRRAESQRHG